MMMIEYVNNSKKYNIYIQFYISLLIIRILFKLNRIDELLQLFQYHIITDSKVYCYFIIIIFNRKWQYYVQN